MIKHELRNLNYFNNDIRNLGRYIEFSKTNYPAYSMEIASLILICCTEIDSILHIIVPNSKGKHITFLLDYLKNNFALFYKNKFEFYCNKLEFEPWKSIIYQQKKNKIPKWWTAYNKIKHNRYTNLQKANVKNLLESTAALYSIVYLHGYIINNNSFYSISQDYFTPLFTYIPECDDGFEDADVGICLKIAIN